jgi:hypothetical protein
MVHKTLSWENVSQKRAGGVAQGVCPVFKPQHWKIKTNKKRGIWNKEDRPRYKREAFAKCRKFQGRQAEILEIKSTLNKLRNTVEIHSSMLEQVEDRI